MRARRVREVRQFAPAECGLCCIAMVLSAYGSRNSVTALRRAHDTGRDGLSIREVVSILQGYGMRTRIYRASANSLTRLSFPLIAYWDDSHLVVVEKVTADQVLVSDPATGRQKLTLEEFERRYSGLVIEPTPTDEYRPVRHRERSVWRDFLAALAQRKWVLAQALGLSLALYSFMLVTPVTVQYAINNFASFFEQRPLYLAMLALTVPMVAYFAFSLVRTFCLASIIRSLGDVMMGKTFRTLLGLPYKYFASRSQGELMYRLQSVSAVRDLISTQLPAVLLDVGSLAVAFAYIFHRSTSLGLAALAVFLCMVTVATVTYRPIRRAIDREISENADSTTMQLEAMSSIEALKVSGMTSSFFEEWRRVYARVLRQTHRRIILQGTASSGYGMFQMFGPLLVLLFGLWLVFEGSLDLGSAVAVQALTGTALGMVASLSGSFTQLILANAQVARIGDILHQPPAPPTFGDRAVEIQGSLSLRQVSFAYPGTATPVVEDVTFQAPAGARVAIVGSTGSGKSTLGKLLMGLYPVSDGEIAYDGVPMREISPESFYRSVSYVPQEVALSNRAIQENIRFGVPEIDFESLVDAARRAQLHEDVEAMPLGYFTQVREMGSSLSGGQRQRVALARALARRPRVLVLDEATSSLDTVTESRITDALSDLACTQVIIAHRLSTIVNADLIVVLHQGRVVQTGKHDDLVSVPGPYQELVRAQVHVGGGDAMQSSNGAAKEGEPGRKDGSTAETPAGRR